MGLKIWLPLLGSFKNQGTNYNEIELASGNSWFSSGKIGAQALKLTKQQIILSTTSCMSGVKQMSYAFWVKVNTAWSTDWLDGIRWTSTDGSSVHVSRQEFYDNCTKIGTWYSGGSISGKSFAVGTWTHIAATYDYNIGKATFYINGVQVGINADLSTSHYCRGDFYIGDDNVDILENDVRIYDHCLSPLEVKEISQGLVLHYKLDGPWGGVGANLLQYSNQIGSSSTYGWINNGTTNYSVEKIEGNIIHYKGTVSNSQYIPTISTNVVAPCELGKTYTYSVDFKCDKDVSLGTSTPAHFWLGARQTNVITDVAINNKLSGWSGNYLKNHTGILPANTWATIITILTLPTMLSHEGYNYPAIRPFIYGKNLTENYTGEVNIWIRNCKIEEGNKATAWIPAFENEVIDTTKIQDSSGYNNHGTLNDTLIISTDTPRYISSTYFNGTENSILVPYNSICPDNIFTLNLWFKKNIIGSKTYETLFGGPNGFEMDTRNGASNNLSLYMASVRSGGRNLVTSLSLNEWYMVTMTRNNEKEKYYINGIFQSEIDAKSMPTGNYYIGAWKTSNSQNYCGYISDFRIYCTELLDKDIELLYNSTMRIDNFGGIHEFELEENSNQKLTKTGILESNYFLEEGYKFNTSDGWSYSPNGDNNSTTGSATIKVDLSPLVELHQPITLNIEGDITWSNFTPNGNGTLRANFQGANYAIGSSIPAWSGTNYTYYNSSFVEMMSANSSGTYHFQQIRTIPTTWFDTYYASDYGFRTDYATGTITLSNLKITLVRNQPKINSKYIAGENLIEV